MTDIPSITYFGAYFAILPALPSISPTKLKEVCERLELEGLESWTHDRIALLHHPQLKDPLQYLEISAKIASQSLANEIVEILLLETSIIGNAEVLLILPDTPIPLMPTTDLPTVATADTFHQYGLVGMKDAMDDVDGLHRHAMQEFERLYDALQKHDANGVWREYEETGRWKPLVNDILGPTNRLVKCGCVLSLPSCGMQYWHSDGVHRGKSADFDSQDAALTHALCVFVPLIDLTEATGCTEFWAGSHKYSKLLQKGGEQSLPGGTIGLMKKGDALRYDYRTIHRGTANSSRSARPVCYFLYAREGYEDVEDQNFRNESVFDASTS
ncbi:phytanoyl-CoA dioxygenase [Fragilaria crotonensis]|nr:phytanoyl-CoA dioxygenase [Fragilaria crotonensis]